MTGLLRALWAIAMSVAAPAFASEPIDGRPDAQDDEGKASQPAPATFSSEDLVLLEVRSEGETLSDGIGAYAALGGVYLPLGELSRLLGIAITVEPELERATGWIGSRERTFMLDLKQQTAMFDNRTIRFSPGDATLFSRSIFARHPAALSRDRHAGTSAVPGEGRSRASAQFGSEGRGGCHFDPHQHPLCAGYATRCRCPDRGKFC
jgi:hypothetical protein